MSLHAVTTSPRDPRDTVPLIRPDVPLPSVQISKPGSNAEILNSPRKKNPSILRRASHSHITSIFNNENSPRNGSPERTSNSSRPRKFSKTTSDSDSTHSPRVYRQSKLEDSRAFLLSPHRKISTGSDKKTSSGSDIYFNSFEDSHSRQESLKKKPRPAGERLRRSSEDKKIELAQSSVSELKSSFGFENNADSIKNSADPVLRKRSNYAKARSAVSSPSLLPEHTGDPYYEILETPQKLESERRSNSHSHDRKRMRLIKLSTSDESEALEKKNYRTMG